MTDEEKEPQFLIGRSRVNAADFGGAIEAFRRALEINPQSAAAHLQLGWLYAEKNSDPAAAIYHYEQFLQRRPAAPDAEMIRRNILGLKQKLAEDVLPMPPASGAQKQVETLMEENRQLRAELEKLRVELAARSGPTNPSPARVASGRINPAAGGSVSGDRLPPSPLARSGAASPGGRTYKVKPGDTPISIARRYSIKLELLLAANPGLNPKRMRIDQSLTIPGR